MFYVLVLYPLVGASPNYLSLAKIQVLIVEVIKVLLNYYVYCSYFIDWFLFSNLTYLLFYHTFTCFKQWKYCILILNCSLKIFSCYKFVVIYITVVSCWHLSHNYWVIYTDLCSIVSFMWIHLKYVSMRSISAVCILLRDNKIYLVLTVFLLIYIFGLI